MGLEKFSSSLDLLLGYNVNLYIGEDVYNGKLIGVETDHVIMQDENDYIFYYSIDQIQAITKNTKLFQTEEIPTNFLKTQSLTEVLNSFRHSWVSILCVNKQKFNGILSQVDEDFATLINGEDRILIKLSHISNILKGFISDANSASASSQSDSTNENNTNEGSNSNSKESNNKAENKSDSSSNKGRSNSEKNSKSSSNKEKSDKQEDAVARVDLVEANNTMVWSQPIKIEATMVQSKDEVPSNFFKSKKSSSTEKESVKTSTEMKKSKDEMSANDKKVEEVRASKTKGNDQQVKVTVTAEKTDNTPAPPYKVQKTEVKSANSQETAKSSSSPNQTTKKTETSKIAENTVHNSQNGWKPNEQAPKVFRFAGEPVDSQKAFPFAGWPNRNNRTSRF